MLLSSSLFLSFFLSFFLLKTKTETAILKASMKFRFHTMMPVGLLLLTLSFHSISSVPVSYRVVLLQIAVFKCTFVVSDRRHTQTSDFP